MRGNSRVPHLGMLVLLCVGVASTMSGLVRAGDTARHPSVSAANSLMLKVMHTKGSQGPRGCEDETARIPPIEVSGWSRVLADDRVVLPGGVKAGEMPPAVAVMARVQTTQDDEIVVSGTAIMTDGQSGGEAFEGRFGTTLSLVHVLDPLCSYQDVDVREELVVKKHRDPTTWTTYGGKSLIRAVTCRFDPGSAPPPKVGCRLAFRPVRVKVLSP